MDVGLEQVAVGAEIGVAIGTLALAGFTAKLARATSKVAAETRHLVIQTKQDVESQFRPIVVVYPAMGCPWQFKDDGIAVAVMNVGPGVALNLRMIPPTDWWVATLPITLASSNGMESPDWD